MKRFKKAKKWTLDERLLKTLKISVYERYIMFDKNMSDIIFQNHIEGFNFSENDEGIIFSPGYNFKISKKQTNAVIYSKVLANYLRDKINLPLYRGVQRIYFNFDKTSFFIPFNNELFKSEKIENL